MRSEQAKYHARVAGLEHDLLALVQRTEARCTGRVAATYEEWHECCIYVDVTVRMALEDVCAVLPEELQAPIRRLLALYQAVWWQDVLFKRGEAAP